MSYEIRLLGYWEFRCSQNNVTIPPGRLRILLTALALAANQTVAMDTLAEQLWPEHLPMRVRDSLHLYIVRLRKLLGPGAIHTQPGSGYQLIIDPDAVDVHRFRNLLKQARQMSTQEQELRLLRAALDLWRDRPFADLHSTWLDREVAPRLTEEWLAATGRRLELELASEPPGPLIAELRDLTAQYPQDESLWLLLITALHRAGRRADALDAFLRVRAALRDELGIEPGQALVAMQQEILHEGSEQTPAKPPAANTQPTVSVPRQLPHDIARFTGRDTELATLDRLRTMAENAPVPIIISIDGAAGVGKTTLAVHWANQIAQHYPDAQLHLNLRGYGPGSPLTPQAAAETMLRALGVDSDRIPSDLDERSALLRSALSDRRALILLDNARDTEQVLPLLPGTGGLVIVTSRSQLRGLSIRAGARRVTLRPLPRQQSVELLAAAVGHRLVAEDPAAAAALAELCDNLPLALAIVAERAQRGGSLAEVVAALENEQARLDTLDTGEGNVDSNLRAALSWSYRALSPEAATMFRKLGLHPANDIGQETAAALANVPVPQAQAALDQLVAAHLTEQRRPGRYELHDLIRLYATELANQDAAADREATIRRVLDWYLHAAASADRTLVSKRRHDFLAPYEPSMPSPEFTTPSEATAWFEQEYECLRSVVCWSAQHGYAGHVWRISLTMTTFYDHLIPWRDGLEFFEHAFAAAQRSGELVGEAFTLNSLGCICLDMSDWKQAKSYFEQSYARFEDLSHAFGQAMTLGNLALAQGELDEVDEALKNASRAVELYEQLGWARGIAVNLDNLGMLHTLTGEYEQAVDYCQKARTVIHQIKDVELEAWILLHLARAYSGLRDFPKATRTFRQAIAVHREHGNDRWMAIVLNEFGAMIAEAGHPTIARAMRQTALVTLTKFADPRAEEIEAALAAMP